MDTPYEVFKMRYLILIGIDLSDASQRVPIGLLSAKVAKSF